MINTNIKDEKMFVSIVANEFFDREKLEEYRRPPDGMFRESCKNGVVWGTLITSDFVDTMTRLALSMPTYGDKVIFFTSDDYHKIDKFEWEKASQPSIEDESIYIYPYDYVDDSIDDKYAEYIVSYDSIKLVDGFVVFDLFAENFSLYNMGSKTMSYMATVPGLENIFKGLIGLYGDAVDCQIDGLLEDGLAYINEEGVIIFDRVDLSCRSASLLICIIMPFIINIKCNSYFGARTAFPFSLWAEYCMKYLNDGMDPLYDIRDVYIDENSTREDFDRYRTKIFDFYDVSSNNQFTIIHARLMGFPGNEKCPCGSGKVWKQCHGKNYRNKF